MVVRPHRDRVALTRRAVNKRVSREERTEATRRAIIAAALRLLDERSFNSLTLREVAREAGITPGALSIVLSSLRLDGKTGPCADRRVVPDTARLAAPSARRRARPASLYRVLGRHPRSQCRGAAGRSLPGRPVLCPARLARTRFFPTGFARARFFGAHQRIDAVGVRELLVELSPGRLDFAAMAGCPVMEPGRLGRLGLRLGLCGTRPYLRCARLATEIENMQRGMRARFRTHS